MACARDSGRTSFRIEALCLNVVFVDFSFGSVGLEGSHFHILHLAYKVC